MATTKQEKANAAVRYAVKTGKLVRQPCEVCGTTESIQAHHDDYLKKLDVRWLCIKHHAEWHIKNGPGKTGTVSTLIRQRQKILPVLESYTG